MTIGEKILLLRKEKNLSQDELSAKLEVSRQAISKWELGDSIPDVDKIVAISKFFSVTTDYLLKDDAERNSTPQTAPPKDNSASRILFVACTFFALIGLLCALGNWYDTQNGGDIAGGMIIQLTGLAALGIGKALAPKEKVPLLLSCLNLAILLFMPISVISSLIFNGFPMPYPTDIWTALMFVPADIIAVGAGIFALISHEKKSKRSGNNS